ncbi:Cytochrome c oxidase subunit 6 like protein [Verticillium longisporum]|uniref:Cytochrome c oxidase subunit 6, mitochondrial n=1 Tax=Verticillium longisporum TaxID=100787 RepID=A0A8I2ZCD0_VERLO|nr:Cytochrome c oxidase subunit 6 like protein [Verticillium longisporum]
MSAALLRVAARRGFFNANPVVRSAPLAARAAVLLPMAAGSASHFSTVPARRSEHQEETFEEFSARFEKEFDAVNDVFELQRNLNNAFAYDLVPSPTVVAAALKAARRVNDFATAVRVFEGVKAKVENKGQYEQYLRLEFGDSLLEPLSLKEDIYPEQQQQ